MVSPIDKIDYRYLLPVVMARQITPIDKIDYRYLNLDTRQFVESQSELAEQIGKGGLLRAIPNIEFGQVLIAASRSHFDELQAITVCRRIANQEKDNER